MNQGFVYLSFSGTWTPLRYKVKKKMVVPSHGMIGITSIRKKTMFGSYEKNIQSSASK